MNKSLIALLSGAALLVLQGCAQGDGTVNDKSRTPCGDKPNCVSSIDPREEYAVAPFVLVSDEVSIPRLVDAVLTLPGARVGTQEPGYARIEFVSSIMRFVDDVELRIDSENLIVRSESRVGYSDFGVNRKRVEALRTLLQEKGFIQ
ncbi:hypothetical protein A1OO_21145 [Enterovibrio norvegicus FF-33]|uniref:DUF1499 domain-containing protein n=1 Tax=Enterovibrio norvegicus TaxID=188144 RepID=UPI0002E34116|nr:DUF1499 domain-containing protein [Enterovibrio norvegicus]OEE68234.1 hypothetical protein A1OO_21145 [Enterovibrio norvegicus FF-33]